MKRNNFLRAGQSLIELLLALSVAVVAIISGFLVLSFLIKRVSDEGASQAAVYLREDVIKKIHALSDTNYSALIDSSLSPATYYRLVTASDGTLSLASGVATEVVSGKVYSVSVRILPVYRDANRNIVSSGGTEDKNTREVSAMISWTGPDGQSSLNSSSYVARDRNYSFRQTDWSGGATNATDPLVSGSAYNKYKQASGVDVSTSPGRVVVP